MYFENTSIARTAITATTRRGGRLETGGAVFAAPARLRCWARAQLPTFQSTIMPRSASTENQAIDGWPNGSTTKAASSGPIAVPVLPPTWNTDWARP